MNKWRALIITTLICVTLLTISFSVLAANKIGGQNHKIATTLSITVRPATWTENCTEIITIYGRLAKLRPTRGIPGKLILIRRKISAGWAPFTVKRTDSDGKYRFEVAVDDIKDQIDNNFKAIFRGDSRYKSSEHQDATRWSGNPPCPESD